MNDDELRVHADALLERGEPQGELIHIQLDLASRTWPRVEAIARRLRERELFRAHTERWIAPYRALVTNTPVFRRGVPDEVAVDAAVFAERGGELLAAAPTLRSIVLHNLVGNLDWGLAPVDPPEDVLSRWRAVIASPWIEQLVGLEARVGYREDTGRLDPEPAFVPLGGEAAAILATAAPRLGALHALKLHMPTVEGAGLLARSGLLGRLEHLDMSDWTIEAVEHALTAIGPLRSVALPAKPGNTLATLLAHPQLESLEHLTLRVQMSGSTQLAARIASLTSLRKLELETSDALVFDAVASSPHLRELDVVRLSPALLDPSALDHLRVLRWRNRYADPSAVRALFASPLAKRLEVIDVRENYGAHLIRQELAFDGLLQISERWGVSLPQSLYGWNHHEQHYS